MDTTYPTPNTQHTTEETSSDNLSDFAIGYRMKVCVRNPTGKVKAAQQAVADKFGNDHDKTTGGTYLLEQRYLKPLLIMEREIRDFFSSNTTNLDGKLLISSNNYFRIQEYVSQAIPEFDKLKSDFLTRWETEIRPKSKEALHNQKDASGENLFDKLTPAQKKWFTRSSEEMAQYYSFTFKEDNIPSSNLKGVSQDIINGVRARIKHEEANTIHEANAQLRGRLKDVVSKLKNKMADYNQDGSNRMHDSIIDNIRSLVEVLPDMIIGNDPELVELCNETKVLCAWDVEVLKGNEHARVEAKQTANNILSKMSF